MSMRSKLCVAVVTLSLLLGGCNLRSSQPVAAGIFRSTNSSEEWQSQNLYLHSGGTGSIGSVNIIDIIPDPQDPEAFYLTTTNGGLLYSYDAMQSWRKADLPSSLVRSLAIDPVNKCTLYATIDHTIRKSTDCARSWSEAYIEPRQKPITALAIDSFNNLVVYAGTSEGDVLKSSDGGRNWQVVDRLKDRIAVILISKEDTRIIYVATAKNGLYKTADAGATWMDLNNGIKPYSSSKEYKDLIFIPSEPNGLLYASKYGLLKTVDGGETWTPIELITPVATVDIFSVAVDPTDSNRIYYGTGSTFYKTTNGGTSWITSRLPAASWPTALLVDPTKPNVIYMGMTIPQK